MTEPLETPSELDEILKQHREWMRGIRTDRLVGTSHEQTKAAIERLIAEEVEKATNDAYDLLFWKYKEMNHQSVDRVFAEAYGFLKEEIATLTNTESKT